MWRVVDDEGTTAGRSTRSSRRRRHHHGGPARAGGVGARRLSRPPEVHRPGPVPDDPLRRPPLPLRTRRAVLRARERRRGRGSRGRLDRPGRMQARPRPRRREPLLVQMAPDWSAEYYHEPALSIVDAAADKTAALLDDERPATPTGPTTSTGATRCPTADPPSARSTTPPNTTSFSPATGSRATRAPPRGGPERSRNGRRGRGPVLRRVRSGFASRTALHYHGPEAGS